MEASRLARSNADWHRLIEICGIMRTLIIDEDGCYDPSDFNDGLLLGLKGTMAQAELHFIRSRLQGGKLNKAKKGELRFPLPVGYVFDESNRIVKDPDEQVRRAIELVFTAFLESGSAYGVVHRFSRKNLLFPKRSYGGVWAGKLQWGRLTDSRVLGILKNPSYAGIYAFGRYRCVKEILEDGEVGSRIARMPRDEWLVEIRDHHEGYTSFEQYLKNLDAIEHNRTNPGGYLERTAREGLAMLQGLLICGRCGRRLTPRYRGNGGLYPVYECNWRKREGLSKTSCMSIHAAIWIALSRSAFGRSSTRSISTWPSTPMTFFRTVSNRSVLSGNCDCSGRNTRLNWHRNVTSRSIRRTAWWPRRWSSDGTTH